MVPIGDHDQCPRRADERRARNVEDRLDESPCGAVRLRRRELTRWRPRPWPRRRHRLTRRHLPRPPIIETPGLCWRAPAPPRTSTNHSKAKESPCTTSIHTWLTTTSRAVSTTCASRPPSLAGAARYPIDNDIDSAARRRQPREGTSHESDNCMRPGLPARPHAPRIDAPGGRRITPETPGPQSPPCPTTALAASRRSRTDHICSGASMPSRPRPWARVRAVSSLNAKRLARISSPGALSTGQCS
jgi:hypothetical protein